MTCYISKIKNSDILEKYRSNFGEVDVAPAKIWNDKVNKVTKINSRIKSKPHAHAHFKPWKKDVQSCLKLSMKLYKELRLEGTHCLYTFLQSEVRKWQSSQSGKSDKN